MLRVHSSLTVCMNLPSAGTFPKIPLHAILRDLFKHTSKQIILMCSNVRWETHPILLLTRSEKSASPERKPSQIKLESHLYLTLCLLGSRHLLLCLIHPCDLHILNATKREPGRSLWTITGPHLKCSLVAVWEICKLQTSLFGRVSRAIRACKEWLVHPKLTPCATNIMKKRKRGMPWPWRVRSWRVGDDQFWSDENWFIVLWCIVAKPICCFMQNTGTHKHAHTHQHSRVR